MSTYSIILASQVSFNAVFSYFLNKEKFRALILNSVVLLTFSAALVGVSHGSDGSGSDIPKGKFPAGFALTLSASALFSLILSLMQLTFEEVLKSDTLPTVLEMQFWSNTAAACVSVAGLFASGEWRGIAGEMAAYRKGEVAYAMTLAWTAVSWQLCTMGLMGLVAAVSSLFTNVISTVGTPLSPAVIFGPVWHGSTSGSGRSLAKRWFWHRLQVWSCSWSPSRLTLERRSPKTVASSGSVELLHAGAPFAPARSTSWWPNSAP